MRILYVSEVQWLSQPSRKHHLISRFPSDWRVLFVSPINTGASENSFVVRRDRARPSLRFASIPLPKPDSRFAAVRASHRLLSLEGRVLLTAIARTYRPDVVVCSYIWAASAVPAIRGLGVPVVYDCNDLHPGFYPDRREEADAAFRELVESVDEVVSVTDFLRGVCGRGVVIANGADVGHFTAREPRVLPWKNCVVYAGSVGHWLDYDIIARTLDELSGMGDDFGLAFMGRIYGSVADRVEDLRLRYPDHVSFMGRIPYETLPDHLSGCSVGIIPFAVDSFTEAVSPGKLYRYAAMGLNIVSTPFSEDVHRYGDLVYTASEPDGFARAVTEALRDTERRKLVRSRIAEPNSWDVRASEFNSLLARLAHGDGGQE